MHIVMYTRRGCHLCEDAWQLLERAQRQHMFTLEAVDVDSDPPLVEQHGDRVPVVAVNGRVRLWGRINEVLLNRLLRAEEAQD